MLERETVKTTNGSRGIYEGFLTRDGARGYKTRMLVIVVAMMVWLM